MQKRAGKSPHCCSSNSALGGCPLLLHLVNTHLMSLFQLTMYTYTHTPAKNTQLTRASQLPGSFMHFQHSICYKQKLLMRLSSTDKPNHHICLAMNKEPSVWKWTFIIWVFTIQSGRIQALKTNWLSSQLACGNSLQNISHMVSSHKSKWKLEGSGKETPDVASLRAQGTQTEVLYGKETGWWVMLPIPESRTRETDVKVRPIKSHGWSEMQSQGCHLVLLPTAPAP